MFLPENNFKFVNVSIVTYKDKKTNQQFEIACFPNKLYEYYNSTNKSHQPKFPNNPPTSENNNLKNPENSQEIYQNNPVAYEFLINHKHEILQSENVYRNISKGEIADTKNIMAQYNFPNKFHLIQFIIDNGYERKHQSTHKHEIEQCEREIVSLLSGKIKYKGEYIPIERLSVLVKSMHVTSLNTPIKKQVLEIVRRLCEKEGYSRVMYRVSVGSNFSRGDISNINGDISNNSVNISNINADISNGAVFTDYAQFLVSPGLFLLPSDRVPELVDLCKKSNVDYLIEREDEESVEIC